MPNFIPEECLLPWSYVEKVLQKSLDDAAELVNNLGWQSYLKVWWEKARKLDALYLSD